MKTKIYLKAVGHSNGIFSSKRFLYTILWISSTLSAATDGLEDELNAQLPEETQTEELAAFDSNIFSQQSIPQGIKLPDPVFKLDSEKNSFLAVGLSILVPGLGHVYLGDMKTAAGLIGNTGLSMGAAAFSRHDDFVQSTSFLALETTWLYGIYAAYRDVRSYNRQAGYSYAMPSDSFLDLTMAPFNLKILKKPEVWGGLLGSLAIAFTTAYLTFSENKPTGPANSLSKALSPLTAFPIGIGEESFFRGFLLSQFSEWLSPWGGIVLSSAVFGLAHMPNAWDLEPREKRGYYTTIVPLIALSGIYDGWLTHKNHSLKESVAIHVWYDFILFTIGALASDAVFKGRPEFALTFSF